MMPNGIVVKWKIDPSDQSWGCKSTISYAPCMVSHLPDGTPQLIITITATAFVPKNCADCTILSTDYRYAVSLSQ